MAWLLDTNVVSELRKIHAGKGSPEVAAWQADIAPEECHLSAITVMELEMGVLQIERRDLRQGTLLRQWLSTVVLPEFAGRVLPFDEAAALRCAALHVPDPKSWRDAAIAATALVHGLTIVTRNIRDFAATGVATIDPWVGS